jgi:hypothetical protein
VGAAGAQEPVVRGAEAHLPGCRATIPKEIFFRKDASSDPKRIDARMPRYNPEQIFYSRKTPFLIPKESMPGCRATIPNRFSFIKTLCSSDPTRLKETPLKFK